MELFLLSAEKGLLIAQASLGSMYRFGEGGKKDLVLAHMWTNIASMRGDYSSNRNTSLIEREMTDLQISHAKKLAVKCKFKEYIGCVSMLTGLPNNDIKSHY